MDFYRKNIQGRTVIRKKKVKKPLSLMKDDGRWTMDDGGNPDNFDRGDGWVYRGNWGSDNGSGYIHVCSISKKIIA